MNALVTCPDCGHDSHDGYCPAWQDTAPACGCYRPSAPNPEPIRLSPFVRRALAGTLPPAAISGDIRL